MMEHIAISVIVPIYNTKPYLEECIESILDQNTNNLFIDLFGISIR